MYSEINSTTARAWANAKLVSNGKPRYTAYVEDDGSCVYDEEIVIAFIDDMGYSIDQWYDTAYDAMNSTINKMYKLAKKLEQK